MASKRLNRADIHGIIPAEIIGQMWAHLPKSDITPGDLERVIRVYELDIVDAVLESIESGNFEAMLDKVYTNDDER